MRGRNADSGGSANKPRNGRKKRAALRPQRGGKKIGKGKCSTSALKWGESAGGQTKFSQRKKEQPETRKNRQQGVWKRNRQSIAWAEERHRARRKHLLKEKKTRTQTRSKRRGERELLRFGQGGDKTQKKGGKGKIGDCLTRYQGVEGGEKKINLRRPTTWEQANHPGLTWGYKERSNTNRREEEIGGGPGGCWIDVGRGRKGGVKEGKMTLDREGSKEPRQKTRVPHTEGEERNRVPLFERF